MEKLNASDNENTLIVAELLTHPAYVCVCTSRNYIAVKIEIAET